MTTRRVSVTLAADAVERARCMARPRGLSSYLDCALAEKLDRDEQRRTLLAYLDEVEGTDPTPESTKGRAQTRADRIRAQASS